MVVCTVVGARPQFVKASALGSALELAGIEERLVHSGQHYDDELSRIFFDELEIRGPVVNLGVGSGSHAEQTGAIMVRFEEYLLGETRPDCIIVFGDTNTTIAAAVVGSKLHIPVAHVEAGLRSFNRRMPEEINRVVTDHLSDLCFCPTRTAVENLRREGVTRGVYLTGDVMLDATRRYADVAAQRRSLADICPFESGAYYLATVHRAENADDPGRLEQILSGLGRLNHPVVFPVHPRTRARIDAESIEANIHLSQPIGYLAMLTLIRHARAVLTDSGGLQKEALWLETPCITFREETEWLETLEGGWNQLVGADEEAIVEAASRLPSGRPGNTGEPGATGRIAQVLLEWHHHESTRG